MGVFTGIEPTWAAETNIGRTHIATKGVVQDGLVLNLDAGVSSSYPGSGTTWTDLSGNGNNGTLVNGVGFDSANGGSLDFEQTNTYADFGNILNFTTENFTFNTFLYLTSNTNTNNQNPILVYKGQFQANGYYIQFGGTSPAIVSFVTNQSGASQVTESSSSLVVGAWNCLSIVRNGSSVRIYVNAVDVTSTAGTHINPASSGDPFLMSTYNYVDLFSDVRIASFQAYNKALTAQEIQQNYLSMKSRFGL